MPPRLRPTAVSPSSLFPPSSAISPTQAHLITSRQFCSSPRRHYLTKRQQELADWLNGPGLVFKEPLPGRTNYLGAYSPEGKHILDAKSRSRDNDNDNQKDEEPENIDDIDGDAEPNVDADAGVEGMKAEGAEDAEQNLSYSLRKRLRSPFPLNKQFVSQAVLSEELKEHIYDQVVQRGQKVVAISAQLGVSMERIAAVIRLKEVEKQWVSQGKPLATPYAEAVMDMLPQTSRPNGTKGSRHETINDLPVHRATLTQIFHPVPESRRFTRADAARVFHHNLLPADNRIPHPELILLEKARLVNLPRSAAAQEVQKFLDAEEKNREDMKARQEKNKARHERVYASERFDFVIQDCNVEDVGKDGRAWKGVGWRYGMPLEDRKKGQVKIPTSVPV